MFTAELNAGIKALQDYVQVLEQMEQNPEVLLTGLRNDKKDPIYWLEFVGEVANLPAKERNKRRYLFRKRIVQKLTEWVHQLDADLTIKDGGSFGQVSLSYQGFIFFCFDVIKGSSNYMPDFEKWNIDYALYEAGKQIDGLQKEAALMRTILQDPQAFRNDPPSGWGGPRSSSVEQAITDAPERLRKAEDLIVGWEAKRQKTLERLKEYEAIFDQLKTRADYWEMLITARGYSIFKKA